VVTLRPATANDAPKIAEIWHHGWHDGHLGFVPQELVAARHEASFRSRAAQQVSDTTVAVVDGEVAGFVMVVGDEVETGLCCSTPSRHGRGRHAHGGGRTTGRP
jgi:L-amino acid N-acyltransferase YncA